MGTPPFISVLIVVILAAVGLLVCSMAALWLNQKIKFALKNNAQKKQRPNSLKEIDSAFQKIMLSVNNSKQTLTANLVSPGATYDNMIWYEDTINAFFKNLQRYFSDMNIDMAIFVVYAARPDPVFSICFDVNQMNQNHAETRKAFDYAVDFVKLDHEAADKLLNRYCKEADHSADFCHKYG